METKKTYQIVEVVLMFLLISCCRDELSNSTNAQKPDKELVTAEDAGTPEYPVVIVTCPHFMYQSL